MGFEPKANNYMPMKTKCPTSVVGEGAIAFRLSIKLSSAVVVGEDTNNRKEHIVFFNT